MLLKKLNAICEEVKCSLTDKNKSVDPAPQQAAPNQSLNDKEYFNDEDDTAKSQKVEVPSEFAKKYNRKSRKSKSK